jgi:hypothetical protein
MSLDMLATRGRLVLYGQSSGRAAQISKPGSDLDPRIGYLRHTRSPANLAAPVAGDRFARPGSRRADYPDLDSQHLDRLAGTS